MLHTKPLTVSRPCWLLQWLGLTLRLWKPVQAGTPSLNFSLTMARMLITWPSEAVAASKKGHR